MLRARSLASFDILFVHVHKFHAHNYNCAMKVLLVPRFVPRTYKFSSIENRVTSLFAHEMPPKSLNKVQKHISKKKGRRPVLHERSRDAQKLRQALSRSDKVNKLVSVAAKAHQPLSEH